MNHKDIESNGVLCCTAKINFIVMHGFAKKSWFWNLLLTKHLRSKHLLGVPGPLVRNGGKSYWFSWRAFRGQRNPIEPQKSWEEARKTCQKYCMDLVTIESQAEDKMISETLVKSKVYGIWTGGQICQEATCMENNSKSTWVWKPSNLVINHNRYTYDSYKHFPCLIFLQTQTEFEKFLQVCQLVKKWSEGNLSTRQFHKARRMSGNLEQLV